MLKSKTTIGIDSPIPTPESVSEPYRKLIERRDALAAESHLLEAETAAIRRDMAVEKRSSLQDDRVAALIDGSFYEPPRPLMDRLGEIERKKRLVHAALSEIASRLQGERVAASALAVKEVQPVQKELAVEFYRHLAAAVAVHSKLGNLKQRIERAGLDSGSLHDFGREICGVPLARNGHAAYALRDGVKRGYIAGADAPKGYV